MDKIITIERKTYNELLRLKLILEQEKNQIKQENERIRQENCYLKNQLAIMKS